MPRSSSNSPRPRTDARHRAGQCAERRPGLVATALAEGRIGTPRLVYAEMEDGPVFRDKWADLALALRRAMAGLHEFEIGCTLEHAGYALSWLVSLFGAVESLTAFSALTFPDKGPGTRNIVMAPDFSVGCLNFRSGLVARLTSGLAAPKDRSLTILGDKGSITVRDLWDNRSAVYRRGNRRAAKAVARVVNRLEARLGRFLPWKPTPGRRIAYPAAARAALAGLPLADRLLPGHRRAGQGDRGRRAAVLLGPPRAAHHRTRAGAEQMPAHAAALPASEHVLIVG